MAERKKLNSSELRLERTISPDEVQWNRVLELLTSRFKVSPKEARRNVSKVYGCLSRPMELHWVIDNSLSQAENLVAQSIAEVHGADRLKVYKDFLKVFGDFKFGISQKITLHPAFSEESRGSAKTEVTLFLGKRSFQLENYRSIVSVRLFSLLSLVILYVALAGLLFYGLAALIALILMPADGIIAATSNGKVGLALLACLVGIAGLTGRVCRDLFGRVSRKLRNR